MFVSNSFKRHIDKQCANTSYGHVHA